MLISKEIKTKAKFSRADQLLLLLSIFDFITMRLESLKKKKKIIKEFISC